MNKLINILSISFFITSCSSSRNFVKVEKDLDAFRKESYARVSTKNDSDGIPKKYPEVIACYNKKSLEVLAYYRSTFKANNKQPFYFNHLANCLYTNRNFEEASFIATYVLSNSKDSSEKSAALNLLGVISIEKQRYTIALNYLTKALELNPSSLLVRFNIASLHLEFEMYDKVIATLLPLRNTQDPFVTFLLAHCNLMKNNLKSAEHYFSLLSNKEKTLNDRNVSYAYFLMKIGKHLEAKSVLISSKSDYSTRHKEAYSKILKIINSQEKSI